MYQKSKGIKLSEFIFYCEVLLKMIEIQWNSAQKSIFAPKIVDFSTF